MDIRFGIVDMHEPTKVLIAFDTNIGANNACKSGQYVRPFDFNGGFFIDRRREVKIRDNRTVVFYGFESEYLLACDHVDGHTRADEFFNEEPNEPCYE